MTTEASDKPKKSRTASPETTGDGYVRLHITPFDADLLKIVVPAVSLPSARNISYHTIDTFPEKRFGFIEMPQVDADKIKKKLNGMVLKGSKMRIEKARPEKRIEPESEDDTGKKSKKSKSKKDGDEWERPTKRKREMGVIDGVMLDDRKVKRGWTEPADYKNKKSKDGSREHKASDKDKKRKSSRSKYVEKEECLLKTRMPPNEMRNLLEEDTSAKKKKKKGNTRQVTVHEFEKATKFMNFLRSDAPETKGKPATEFIEGKGWVDEDGNVVEVVKEKEIPKSQPKKSAKKKVPARVESESEDDSTSESDTSEDDTSSEEESEDDEPMEDAEKPKTKKAVSETKDDGSDSDSSEDESSDDESETPTPETKEDAASNALSIDVPPPPTTPKAVHPLEALYKRSKSDANGVTTPGAEKSTGFSFFGGDVDEEEEEDGAESAMPAVPMTPFTKQDFEWRNVRSAAPTPDTVHPARMRSFFPSADDDADMAEAGEEEDGYDEDAMDEDAGVSGQQGTSDFQKWFWENRRDLNRSWMTRRKTAAKEKRHRDNKARASKAA